MAMVSKTVGTGSVARMSLFPRNVPTSATRETRLERDPWKGYRDALHPDDWVFIFVDPQDGGSPEPLFLGFLDRVSGSKTIDAAGQITRTVEVSATGWEKALHCTQAIASPYISREINLATLIALGPSGGNPPESDEDDPEAVGTSLFSPLVHRLIEWLLQTFLTAGRDQTESDIAERISAEVSHAGETYADGRDVRPILGQFELPGLNIPLWDFIKLKFEDVQQRCILNPSMFLDQLTMSLSQLIDAFSNQVMNEIFYDVRRISEDGLRDIRENLDRNTTGGYDYNSVTRFVEAASGVNPRYGSLVADVAPYMVFRKRPLFKQELLDLEGPIVSEADLVSLDLGASDVDLHNLTILNSPSLTANSPARINSGFPGLERYRAETLRSIRRHGLRLYNDTVIAWPAQFSAPHPVPELVSEYDLRLHRAGLDNVDNWSGSAVLPRYMRGLHLAGRFGIVPHRPAGTEDDSARVYQVDSIDYDYKAGNGAFTTSVGLVRGQSADELLDEYNEQSEPRR